MRKAARGGTYRRQVMEQEEKQQMPSYAMSLFLLAIICVLGITVYSNYQKMDAMEATLAQMNGVNAAVTEQTEKTEDSGVKVESVIGNVPKQDESEETTASVDGTGMVGAADDTTTAGTGATDDTTTAGTGADLADGVTAGQTASVSDSTATASDSATATDTAAETATATDTTADSAAVSGFASDSATTPGSALTSGTTAATEAQTYLSQGYYIVQKGDTLVGICQKIYQTTALMDELCEVNGIENQDSIYAGQKLLLPD